MFKDNLNGPWAEFASLFLAEVRFNVLTDFELCGRQMASLLS